MLSFFLGKTILRMKVSIYGNSDENIFKAARIWKKTAISISDTTILQIFRRRFFLYSKKMQRQIVFQYLKNYENVDDNGFEVTRTKNNPGRRILETLEDGSSSLERRPRRRKSRFMEIAMAKALNFKTILPTYMLVHLLVQELSKNSRKCSPSSSERWPYGWKFRFIKITMKIFLNQPEFERKNHSAVLNSGTRILQTFSRSSHF